MYVCVGITAAFRSPGSSAPWPRKAKLFTCPLPHVQLLPAQGHTPSTLSLDTAPTPLPLHSQVLWNLLSPPSYFYTHTLTEASRWVNNSVLALALPFPSGSMLRNAAAGRLPAPCPGAFRPLASTPQGKASLGPAFLEPKSGFLSEPRAFRLQSGNDHSPSLFLTELSGIRGERAKTQPGLGSGETPKMGDSALIKTHPFLESVLALLLVEDAGEAWVWQGRNESYPGNTRGLSTFPSQQLPGLSPSLPQRGLSR